MGGHPGYIYYITYSASTDSLLKERIGIEYSERRIV